MLRSLRTFLIGGAITALAITALGAPVGAADTKGTLAIVNGIPGKRVDVCLNGKEIKSGLKYGSFVLRNVVPTGNKNLKIYRRDPRTCRGNLLAQKQFPLAAAEDLTIVATKNGPNKIVTFDNVNMGEIPPLGAPFGYGIFAWRSAADIATNFKYTLWIPDASDVPIAPTVDPLWVKGDHLSSATLTNWIWSLRATLPESPDTIAQKRVLTMNERRYEWILVGTHPNNTKFVLLNRAISQPTP